MSEPVTPSPATKAAKPVVAKKSRQQRIREIAQGIFEKHIAFKAKEMHELMILEAKSAAKEKRDPIPMSEFKQTYVQTSLELSDMAITAAAAFDASWERVKGKYKEQEE